jgi:hypothetical protein
MRANKPTILPRISGHNGSSSYAYAYEALNGGSSLQNSWRTIWAWRRFILGGFLLILLAWLGFGASKTTEIVGDGEFYASLTLQNAGVVPRFSSHHHQCSHYWVSLHP